ncbi:Fe-S cluster assembly ATPase SufC [Pyrobaculum aerophilum]|uniref:Fe-S cluster assembly ATPase SufC n=1 Tax=Pyrobaculum aerophilum TaxID=13773 RepID=A0A371QWZ8_9CREN|nr:Fe-S cluster assembly ATPase SufC [Pyrobaculum aerophilum]RFA94957.1 Fe-S cluster assembly ATPase SufC [Pyrobaculum aerophilum]RFA96279.1 Fe-S cluster assembly ATPase SufC [Pyrobaculum aerophilum]
MHRLQVENLRVAVGGKEILRGVTLSVSTGEVVVLMGPNGSGKSTLFQAIAGNPKYEIIDGDILLDGESIKDLPPEERFARGIYVGFQSPIAVPEVRFAFLLQAMMNIRAGKKLTDPNPQVLAQAQKIAAELGLRSDVFNRGVGAGFSGGEFKRAEVLQALLLNPKFAILDEPDSGLDIDGISAVGKAVMRLASSGSGILISTHYARVLKFIKPTKVYVMAEGRVVLEGDENVIKRIEEVGYQSYFNEIKQAFGASL